MVENFNEIFLKISIQASDIYLKMAIGNAPWPIGVDQVGIHMRPSRETISMRYVAHVLNDETQRKFIQGFFTEINVYSAMK